MATKCYMFESRPSDELFPNHIDQHPSKMTSPLKTHSLTSLNIPFKSSINFDGISPVDKRKNRAHLVGSVDSICERPQIFNRNQIQSGIPLVDKKASSIYPNNRNLISSTNSFFLIKPTCNRTSKIHRSNQLQNFHRSSLQNIRKIVSRTTAIGSIHPKSIPKFSFKNLPSNSSVGSSNQRTNATLKFTEFPFVSLPEIPTDSIPFHLHSTQTRGDQSNADNLSAPSSWTKSSSWSWKSNPSVPNMTRSDQSKSMKKIEQEEIIRDRNFHSQLPIIIESPIQRRSDEKRILSPVRSSSIQHSIDIDQSLEHIPYYLNKKPLMTHSISNYEISSYQNQLRSSLQYPSTPILTRSPRFNRFITHSSGTASTDDEHSISPGSSFRSCFETISQITDYDNTDLTSVTQSYLDKIPSDMNCPFYNEKTLKKKIRPASKHFCVLQ